MTDQSLEPTSSKANSQSVSPKTKNNSSVMGRPTKLTDEVRQKAKNYLSEIEKTKDIPYLEQLAYKLDVDMDTMKNWCDVDEEFFGTYKKIQIYQRYMLQKGSVLGTYNPASSIFQLKANHGMIETEKHIQEVNISNVDEAQLDAAIRQKASEVGAL